SDPDLLGQDRLGPASNAPLDASGLSAGACDVVEAGSAIPVGGSSSPTLVGAVRSVTEQASNGEPPALMENSTAHLERVDERDRVKSTVGFSARIGEPPSSEGAGAALGEVAMAVSPSSKMQRRC